MIKKFISSILTVALLASCITFSGNESKAKADSTSTDTKQIVEPGGIKEVDKDKVTTSKTIVETGVENEFEITLQVTTEEDLENIKISPDAATVLVLDKSGSMDEKDGDSTSRFEEMKSAAKAFLTEYAKVEAGSNAKRLVSIVSFDSDVKNETYDNGRNNWIDVTKSLSDAQAIINKINWPNGGTNIEGALIMANNIVNDGKTNKTLEGIENVNIILLTDGCPTWHVGKNSTNSLEKIDGTRGGGTYAKTTDWQPVGGTVNNVSANSNNISKKIKDSGINLYTIAFSTKAENFYYSSNRFISLNPSDWMATFATRNFSAKDVNELTKQFESINQLIALSAKAWKVTDPMGSNIEYKEITSEKTNNAYRFSGNTLIWDVKNSNPNVSNTDEGNKKYTYTLKYKVVLDTTQKDFNYSEVSTNGDTILDYYLFSKDQSGILKTAIFDVPTVKGLFGEFYFTKKDENNKAMANVTFKLSGTATGSNKPVEMTVISDANGYVSFSNIPAGEYTLTETAPDGYVQPDSWKVVVSYGNVTKYSNLGDTIINYPTSRDITVEKIWDKLPDGETDLPDSVTVRLYKNNVKTDNTLVLDASTNWQGIFSNLPYLDDNGKVISYSVKEDKVVGYETTIKVSNDGNNISITNSYKPERIEISGNKTWEDKEGNNIQGTVPDIEITLQRTTEDNWYDESKIENVKTIELKNGKADYNFGNLPKTATNSKEYKYRVRESKVNGYEPTYNDKFDIVNVYTPGETELTVNKVWENVTVENDTVENDTLPDVKIILYRNNEVWDNTIVLNKNTGYSYTFENLDMYAPTGEEYKYTVDEVLDDNVEGYTKEIISGNEGFTIKNTFKKDATTDIAFTKVWENVPEGEEVPDIKLHLYQNGVELTDKAVTLKGGIKENGTESYVFEDLPQYSTDGTKYVYTVKEDVVNGYKSSSEANAENKYTITNTFSPGTTTVEGTKTWDGITIEDLKNVPTITITLESSINGTNWTPTGKIVELKAGNTTYKFDNLPIYSADGKEYKYRVVEDSVNGYITSDNGSYNILNTYDPGETSVKVTKIWTNVDPNTDTVPEVTIVLKQDGKEVDSVVLNKENGYTYTFDKLAKIAPTGKEYVYTVDEVLEDDVKGYTKQITSGNDGFVVENIFDTSSINIKFNKVWENVPEGAEVPTIKLHLYQNGEELTDKVLTIVGGVKEDGKESYVYKDLPKYSTDGTEYVYTIKEESINGYTSSGDANASNEYTITNTYDGGEKVVIKGTKTWVNVKDADKVPDITIRLLRDGEEIHSIVVPSGTTTYEIALDSMLKYAIDGHEYVYELTEDEIDGFKSERDGYNFTNTNIVKEGVSGIIHINTGDNNIVILYASLAILSLSLISIITLRKRRNSLEK